MNTVACAVLALASLAGECLACEAPDANFARFFERFSDDPAFQSSRLAERIRFGFFVTDKNDKDKRVWREFTPARITHIYRGHIVPETAERVAGYVKHEGSPSKDKRVVRIVKNESDSYVVTLFFEKPAGCWRLYGVQDDSNLDWKL